jgi:Zn-dependent protease
MRSGFRVARLFGVNIRVDWSWLFIFFLVTWNLASVFGEYHGDWGAGLRWGLAVLAAVLFFISVTAHELAHTLVAKAQGVPVRSITLFLFGGVSNIQREPTSPGREFLMAILGPVTSAVIGGLLLLGTGAAVELPEAGVTDPAALIGGLGPIPTILFWLGSINLVLAVFNMIPAYPLDGGRVLRSIFWALSDNLVRATRWASWVSNAISWIMIVSGIAMVFGATVPFFGSGTVNGLWLAFIGWFLNNSATQSYRRVVINDVLEDVPVQRMMRTGPPTVPADISVESVIDDHVMRTDEQSFPVMEGERLVGLVTLEDVRGVSRGARSTTAVREIMTPVDDLVTTHPGEDASEALNKLSQRDVRQLPVLEEASARGQELVGMLRRRDIIKWLQLHADREQIV